MPRKTTTSNSAAGQGTIAVEDDGDLRLVVGSDTDTEMTTYLVCSRTLSRSSPVFKAMLYGSFRESRPADPGAKPWVVELPDDSNVPAAILLDIVHERFDMLPKDITLGILYNILVFADKYDMTSLLHPWIQGWVSSVSPLVIRISPLDVEWRLDTSWTLWKAVVVSRELGALDPLEELVRLMVMNTAINSNGELLSSGQPLKIYGFDEMPLSSPEIFQHAAELRLKLVTEILTRLQTFVSGLRDAIPTSKQGFCTLTYSFYSGREEIDICNATALGFITSVLEQAELKFLWAEPTLSADLMKLYPSSVLDLVQMIKNIAPKYASHHRDCNPMPAVLADIESLITSSDGYLTDETLAYVERQRSKFGDLDFSGQSK